MAQASYPHLKFLGLESWPPGARKIRIHIEQLRSFFKKNIPIFFWVRTNERCWFVLSSTTQWENISISSMEVYFWGVKSSGCENSHVTEVKCSNIPQKSLISSRKRSEMNVKAAEIQSFLATIPYFPAETTFWSKFFHNTDVVRGFSEKIFPWKWKLQNFALTFISLIFRFEILYAKYVDLLDS
jgi:hypothetical protein